MVCLSLLLNYYLFLLWILQQSLGVDTAVVVKTLQLQWLAHPLNLWCLLQNFLELGCCGPQESDPG